MLATGKKPRNYHVVEEPGAFSSGTSSGTYLIYQYDGEAKEVTIPCKHKDRNVTGLGLGTNSVFIYGTVEKLTIPHCIEKIGAGAFSLCPNLTKIEIDADNKHYETDDGMMYTKGKGTLLFTPTNKKSVTIGSKTTVIGTSGLGNLNLDTLVIPKTVKTLSTSALAFSTIKSLTIEEGVETIDNRAFEKMTSNNKVVIPASVKVFGNYTFNSSSVDTVIFSKGMTEIPRYCFYQSHIRTVEIPDTVKTIRKQAFFYCRWLTNISLPASITSIEEDAFGSPISVTRHIYFAGSANRWNRISFGNALPKDTIMHYGNYPDDPTWDSASHLSAGLLVWAIIAIALKQIGFF